MTERDVLTALGASDWRRLNKNQIMSAANFVFDASNNMSNEVRLKILELAPDILNAANSMLAEYQATIRTAFDQDHEVVSQILNQNHDMAKAMFISYHKASEMLKDLIADPNSSFEEKKYWNEQLFRSLGEMREFDKTNKQFSDELDKRNKNFKQEMIKYGGIAATMIFSVAIASLIGGQLKLPTSK